jgi:hypothetical protein
VKDLVEVTSFEPAPEVMINPVWTFRVSNRDALIILKALGGRLNNEDEIKQAEELGDRLTILRSKSLQMIVKAAERAEQHVLDKKSS